MFSNSFHLFPAIETVLFDGSNESKKRDYERQSVEFNCQNSPGTGTKWPRFIEIVQKWAVFDFCPRNSQNKLKRILTKKEKIIFFT